MAHQGSATIELPFFGPLEAGSLSLPVFTLVIAGLDAFNPCAFFVLLFLLSSLHGPCRQPCAHAVHRQIFVLFSGLIYFLFMAAWLNSSAGRRDRPRHHRGRGVAIVIALINIKDYFWFKQGFP